MRDLFALAAPLLLQATPAEPPHFAPPIDTPLVFRSVETRDDAGVHRRFVSERHIVFAREDRGWRALVTLDRTANAAEADVGAMFEAGMRALTGVPITVHLDVAGKVLAVEDVDPLWSRLCDAIGGMAPAAGRARAAALAAALRKTPQPQRTHMLGSLVAPVIGAADTLLAPGTEAPTTLRTRPPAGPPVTIEATRRVRHEAEDRLAITIRGEGDVPLPATATIPAGGSAHIALDRRRLVDVHTGLVLETSDTTSTTVGSGPDALRSDVVTTTTLLPAVS